MKRPKHGIRVQLEPSEVAAVLAVVVFCVGWAAWRVCGSPAWRYGRRPDGR